MNIDLIISQVDTSIKKLQIFESDKSIGSLIGIIEHIMTSDCVKEHGYEENIKFIIKNIHDHLEKETTLKSKMFIMILLFNLKSILYEIKRTTFIDKNKGLTRDQIENNLISEFLSTVRINKDTKTTTDFENEYERIKVELLDFCRIYNIPFRIQNKHIYQASERKGIRFKNE